MMKKIFVTDADSVLFDYIQGIIPFMHEKGIDTSHLSAPKGSSIHIPPHELFNLDPETSIQLIKEFNKSHHIKNLPIFQEESISALNNIKNAGHDIFVLTCLGIDSIGKQNRFENFISHFGNIVNQDQVVVLDISESKAPYLRDIKKQGQVVAHVDDRLKHVYEAQEAGVKPIWYNNLEQLPNDEKHEGIIHKTCWTDIERFVLE